MPPSVAAFGIGGYGNLNNVPESDLAPDAQSEPYVPISTAADEGAKDGDIPTLYMYPTIAELLLAEHERYLQNSNGEIDSKALKSFMEDRYHSFLAAVRLEGEGEGA